MQIVCIHYNCCGYVWKVIFLFLPLSSKYNYRESGPFLVVLINHLRFLRDIPQMPHCPLFDRLVYGGCFIICASIRARDVLPPLSIKVQVVCGIHYPPVVLQTLRRSSWEALVVTFGLPRQWKMGRLEMSAAFPPPPHPSVCVIKPP